jgi:hypothetical protein
MSLTAALDRFEKLLGDSILLNNQREVKQVKDEVKAIGKTIKKTKEVTMEDALLILGLLEKADSIKSKASGPFVFPFDISSLFGVENQLMKLMKKHSEVFMDADALQVRRELHFEPSEDTLLRFIALVQLTPTHQERLLLLENTKTPIKLRLPVLRFQGLAKMDSDLLCLDWFGGKTLNDIMYSLGPPMGIRPPRAIPLSMLSRIDVLERSTLECDFKLTLSSSSNEISREQLRKFWKKNPGLDYHPLREIIVSVKVGEPEEESNKDLETKKKTIVSRIKSIVGKHTDGVDWMLSYIRPLPRGFPSIMRGTLLENNLAPPPPTAIDDTPLTADLYRQLLLDRFDEDNITAQDAKVWVLPVKWGGTWITHDRRVMTGVPIPLVPSKESITAYCIGMLGYQDKLTTTVIERFADESVQFAKERAPKTAGFIVTIPVLMANEFGILTRNWTTETVKKSVTHMTVPVIVDLKENKIHFCKNAPFIARAQYNNARLFIERYLITEQMRLKES